MTPWIIQQFRRDHPDSTAGYTDEQIAAVLMARDPTLAHRSPDIKIYAQQAARKKDMAGGSPFDRQTVSKNYAKAADASTDRSWAEAFKDPFKRGALMAEQAELLTKLTSLSINKNITEENLREISDIHNKFKQFKPNVHMQEYADAHGFMAKAGEFLGWKETPAILYDVLASSMTGQALSGWDTVAASTAAGAATGAAWGVVGGPAAPATSTAGATGGAFYGFAVGMGKTSNDITQASTFIKELGDALGDDVMSDPDKLVREFASNPDAVSKAKKIAMKHGIPVGVIDGFTMGLAGKALGAGRKLAGLAKDTRKAAKFPKSSLLHTAARVGLLATEKTAAAAVPFGFESFMGATGEAIGQKFSKGKVYDWGDVFLEGVAEFGMAPLSITAAHLTRDKSPEVAKAVNDRIRDFRAKGMSSDDQKAQVDEDFNGGHYTPEEAEVLKDDIEAVYQAAVDPENPDGLTESERGAKQGLSKTEARKAILEYLGTPPTAPAKPKSDFELESEPTTTEPEQQWLRGKFNDIEGYKRADEAGRSGMVEAGKITLVDGRPDGKQVRIDRKNEIFYDHLNLSGKVKERVEENLANRAYDILDKAKIDVGAITLEDLDKLDSVMPPDDSRTFDGAKSDVNDAVGNAWGPDGMEVTYQDILERVASEYGMTPEGRDLMAAFGVAMDARESAAPTSEEQPFAQLQRDLFKDDPPTSSTPDVGKLDQSISAGLPPEGAPKSEVEEFGGKVWTSDPLKNKLQELQDKYDRQGAQSLTPDELGSLFSGKLEEGTAISEELSPRKKRKRLLDSISGLRDLIGKVGKADPNLPAIRGELNKLENDLVEVEADLVVREKGDVQEGHPLFDNDLHRQLSTEDYGMFAEHENSPFVIQKGVNKGKRMDTSPIETWRRDASALASQFHRSYPAESADWAWEAFTHTLAQAQKVVSDLKEHGRDPMSEEVMGAYGKFGGKRVLFNKFIDFANKEKERKRIMQEAGGRSGEGEAKGAMTGGVGHRGESWRFQTREGVGADLDQGRDILSDVVESMNEINGEPLDISASDNKALGASIDAKMAENFPSTEERTPQSTASREEAKSKISKYLTDFRNALYKQLGVDRAPSSEFEEWGTVNLARRVMKEVIIPSVIPALERKNQKPSKLGRLIKRRNKIEKELPVLTANLNSINGQTFQKVIKVINQSVAKITAAKLYTDEAIAKKAAADIEAGVSPMTPETQVLHRSLLEAEVTRIVESGILPENSDAVLKVPSGGATVSITAKELIGQLSARKSLLEKSLKEVQTKIDVTADSEVNVRGYEKIKIREKIAKLYKEFNRNRARVGEGMVQLTPPRPSERAKGPYSDYRLDEAYRLVVRKSQQSIIEAGVEEEAFLEASVEAEAYAKSREARLREGAEVEDTLTNQARNNPLYDQTKGNLHVSEAIKNLVGHLTGNDAVRAERLKPLLDLATKIDTEVFLARIQALDGGLRPPAFYSSYTDQIVADTVGLTHSEAFDVMVEEFFHALTADKLATDSAFRSEVESIRKKASAVFDKLTPEQRKAMGADVVSSMDYALESNVEFLAAVMKSFELQELLAGIKTSKKFRGRWANILEQLIGAFKKTIGFVVEEETLLDDAIFVAMQATEDKLSKRNERGINPSDPRAKRKVYRVTQQPKLLKYTKNYHSQVYSQIGVDESSHSEIAQPKPATKASAEIGFQGIRDNIDGKAISDAVGEAFTAALHGTPKPDVEITDAFAQPRPDVPPATTGRAAEYGIETTAEVDEKLLQYETDNEALEFIAKESPSAEARMLAKGLLKATTEAAGLKFTDSVRSVMAGRGSETWGVYSTARHSIEVSLTSPSLVGVTLHEAAHAKTIRSVNGVIQDSMDRRGLFEDHGGKRARSYSTTGEWLEVISERVAHEGSLKEPVSREELAAAELHWMYNRLRLRDDFKRKDSYGATNLDEMIAEAWSNPAFRNYLKGIKVSELGLDNFKGGVQRESGVSRTANLWGRFKQAVADVLGLNIEEASVLSRIMDSSSTVMESEANVGIGSRKDWRSFGDVFAAPTPESALENVRDKQDLTKTTEGPTKASMSIYEKFKEQLVTKSQILDSFVKRMFKDKGISHDLEVPLAGLHELLSGSVQSANAATDNFVYDVEALIGNKEKTTKQWNDFVLLERIKERLRNDRDSKVKDGVRLEELEDKIDTTGDVETWRGTADEQVELIQLLLKSKEVYPYKSVADITRPNGLNDGIRELIAEVNDPSLITETESGVYEGKFVEAKDKAQDHLEYSLYRMLEADLISHSSYNRMSSSTSFYVPFYVAKHFSGEDTFGQLIKGIKEEVELAPMMDAIKFKIYTTKMRVDKNVFMGKIDDFREEFDPEGTHIRVLDADEFKLATMEPNWDAAKFYRNGRLHYLKMEKDIIDLFNQFNPASVTITGRVMKGAGDIFKLGATGINLFFQAGNFLIFDPIRLLTTSKAGLRVKDKGLSPIVLGHQYLKALMAASWRNMTPNSIKNLIRSKTTFDTTKMDTLYQKFIDSGAAGSTIAEYFDKARGIPDPVGKHGGIFRDEGKITKALNWGNAKLSLFGKTLEQTAKMVGMQRMEIFEGIDDLITEVEAEKNVEKKMRLRKALEMKRDAIAIEIRNYAGSPDFMRKGKFTDNEALNVVFMFFNARIQGVERDMSRLSKVFSGKKADRNLALATGLKLSAFAAAPTMMVWAMNRRYKDDYDEISEEEKKRYFMIPLDTKFEHPYIEGKMIRDYIRIPRRESFGVFSYTIEKGLDWFYEEDPNATAEALEFMVESMLPVNVDGLTELNPVKTAESVASSMNPMIKGVFEQLGNRNFFRHKPLVPPSMEDADPEDQYYTSTPDIYKWLGGHTGLGALRVKHLTESLTAGMVTQFTPPKDTGREGFASTPLLHRLARSSYIKESDIAEIMDAADKVDATGRVQRRRMADEWFRRTKGMSVQERVMNLPKPKNHSEKLLNDLIVRRLREQALGLDPDEIRMKHSPVNVRASVVLSQIEDMTPAEVKVYLTDLAQKRILTRETIIAVNQRLRSRGVTLRDYVQ